MGFIKLDHIKHIFERFDEAGEVSSTFSAVDDVSFSVQRGEFIAILGHNGSGKSTLAKHLNALLAPSEGTVYVDSIDTKDEAYLWDVRQKVGMVFQNPDNQIIGKLVEEDVGFGPENMGISTEEIWKRVERSLKAVDMAMYRTSSPNRLSGGQKQRVAIAGVLAMEPTCIVLDEPTAMLDPKGRREVLETVQLLHNTQQMTVILITHDMDEVLYADRVFVMDHGKVVLTGTPREIFAETKLLKELRLDVPQMALLAEELRNRGIALPEDILTKEELITALKNLECK